VFEEGEGVEAVAEGGVEVEEVDSDDAVGLVGEELSPGRACGDRGARPSTRIAADQGLAAVDLAEVWFVD
jgi:hypothetical protein